MTSNNITRANVVKPPPVAVFPELARLCQFLGVSNEEQA